MVFEDTTSIPSLDEISRELIEGLPVELNDPYAKSRVWTRAVLTKLREMGQSRGMHVCCGYGPPDKGGWLLDLVWMVKERREIVLAVESEWGDSSEVEYDFNKLMSIKAPKKLLLFNTQDQKHADEVLKLIEESMTAYPYHLAGEEYMALEVRQVGIFRYHFEVPTNGHLRAMHFETLGEPLRLPIGGVACRA
jgi:hypothetical protein